MRGNTLILIELFFSALSDNINIALIISLFFKIYLKFVFNDFARMN